MSSSLSRFSGWRSRSLSLGEGLTDLTGARDGTRADGVLDRGRRRLFLFSVLPGGAVELPGRSRPAPGGVDLRWGGSMSSSLSRFSGWRSRSLSLGEGLTDLTGARDGTRADGVLDRGRRRLFLFSVLPGGAVELPGRSRPAPAVLVLVRAYAAAVRGFDGLLRNAVHEAALSKEPAADWAGAYELRPVPLPELRKTLFAMTQDASPATAALAEACLAAIDEFRDEHGASEFEPRHPDVEFGMPWPP